MPWAFHGFEDTQVCSLEAECGMDVSEGKEGRKPCRL